MISLFSQNEKKKKIETLRAFLGQMMPSMDLTYVKKIHHNFQVIWTLESSILTLAPLQSTYDNNQLLMRLLILAKERL